MVARFTEVLQTFVLLTDEYAVIQQIWPVEKIIISSGALGLFGATMSAGSGNQLGLGVIGPSQITDVVYSCTA
ncbi:hypothetical protein RRG08_025499 [Elysia crispata]|uniref:Uncharacterized protein n=1 Tax=Elysia crispata TaxID=231223 RepID=A0AAE1CQN3_9GAST|nr:hypothetical protein RRG08_025499 [Elysia crispata]